MTGLPPLRALHYFHQAALHSSFSVAADRLHVTHSAISHQVRQLESWMGKPLFVRGNGRVKLTSHGERLLLSCHQAFSELLSSCETIRTDLRQHISLSCAPSFLSQWLIPRIASFYQRYPEIEIRFQPLTAVSQLRSEHIDVLILSHGEPPEDDIDATLVSEDEIGPLCAPQFASQLQNGSDLSALPLLHADTRLHAWREWAEKAGVSGGFSGGKHFDSLTLGIQAARSGLGILMAPRLLVRQELEDGTLMAPLGFVRVERATWMMTKQSRRHDPAISLFRDWLREAAQP
ncbi:LysR substrate-binding domain-containing protein [Pantoea sp. S-LA4]|jgi:LysR family glycine cleavage system transcriptional activator|uniref:LysR substrate-binding domain-containing protein n=1 Tax=Pantoea TaxID=53335 RepID=UPI001F3B7508|nr:MULTISPECIES: LysR substrate-binding domain-containing protein [Pantoea]UIL51603.1 LysR substrate-binding domain-containing protein [Pantoea agglomerans]